MRFLTFIDNFAGTFAMPRPSARLPVARGDYCQVTTRMTMKVRISVRATNSRRVGVEILTFPSLCRLRMIKISRPFFIASVRASCYKDQGIAME